MKALIFNPSIDLILHNTDLLIFTNFYTKDEEFAFFKSSLIKIPNYDEVSEICIELDDGFDSVQGDEIPFIQGNIYIKSKKSGNVYKTLIASPYIPIKHTKVKNYSVAFQELRQNLIDAIHEEFYQAISQIDQKNDNQTQVLKHSTPLIENFSLIDIWNGISKYFVYGVCGLVLIYMSLGVYEKKVSLDNQINSSLNLSMDAKQLTQNDDLAMDKMFKEIGIDRNSLSSDLSCFSQ